MKKEKKGLHQRKKKFVDWAKAHKKELAIAGISITTVGIAVVFGINNRDVLEEVFVPLGKSNMKKPEVIPKVSTLISEVNTVPQVEDVPEKVIDAIEPVITRAPHEVRMHPRTLPENWKPSLEKINLANELGIDLAPNQTLVNSYRTGEIAA